MADKTKTAAGGKVDADLIKTLAKLLDETGLGEIEYGTETWHVRVAAPTASVVHAPAHHANPGHAAHSARQAPDPAQPGPVVDDISDHPGAVRSPMVGVVYTASDPDTPPFVSVGDAVQTGDTLLLIEAMKVFNPIAAPKAGTVSRILVANGDPVEFGEPLVIIE